MFISKEAQCLKKCSPVSCLGGLLVICNMPQWLLESLSALRAEHMLIKTDQLKVEKGRIDWKERIAEKMVSQKREAWLAHA